MKSLPHAKDVICEQCGRTFRSDKKQPIPLCSYKCIKAACKAEIKKKKGVA